MRLFAALAFLALAFGTSPASAFDVVTDPKLTPSGTYAVDRDHTQVNFAIARLAITDYYGHFRKISGSLKFDASNPTKSAVSITIDTTSIDTSNDALDTELRAPGGFDTAQFPTATFKSTSIERTGPNTGRVTGDLTIRGITKSVTLDTKFNGGLLAPIGGKDYWIGFHATTTVRRADFGLNTASWSPFMGDDVKLIIEALFTQAKE